MRRPFLCFAALLSLINSLSGCHTVKLALYRTKSYLSLLTADASYYLTRNSLNYVTPVMMQDKALALSYTQIGGLTSILPVAYGKANPPQ